MLDDIESLMLFIVIMFDHNTSIFNILRLIGLKQDINTMVLQKSIELYLLELFTLDFQ